MGRSIRIAHYATATALVAAVTGAGILLDTRVSLANLALFYLLPVMVASTRAGLGPGLYASALSALAYNFFLLPPRFTLRVARADNAVTLTVLLGVAVVTSQLAARLRRELALARERAAASAAIGRFERRLASALDAEAVGTLLADELAALLDADVALIDPDALTGLDRAAAEWARDHGDATGRGTATMASADRLFAPLDARVVAVGRADDAPPVRLTLRPSFNSMIEQAAQAIGRLGLRQQEGAIQRLRQRDELQAALLSSVAHDLRTPLTVILSGLAALRDTHDPQPVDDLVAEARKLDRRIGNLLDLARIEAGAIRLALDPTDLVDAVAGAVEDLRAALNAHRIAIAIPPDLPLVRADPQLLHHVLINILDNARRHGPEGSTIEIAAGLDGGAIRLTIADHGPGIPPGREAAIFQPFDQQSPERGGAAGLGLAIVRGFAAAMGIEPSAANGAAGAEFTLLFPAELVLR